MEVEQTYGDTRNNNADDAKEEPHVQAATSFAFMTASAAEVSVEVTDNT